ncbi:hypothetical protein T265_06869 [Opisthorchis viverrini]|uniref:Uncharacterized protein n=1 Tax=Opisthorchis viverrini TaxID=6198 RepID=A0A075AD08_OPIVI|nr:hypothetical protein T265_06869 [Opisthorchis viverrini]KER25769.1 hypothetical protein T265_06869 [Opisthorchis viverrini]
MVQATDETLYQQGQGFNKSKEHSLGRYYSDPNQDDYFIIGPTDKFAPSIAYRNRLKYRRRSASLRRQDSPGNPPNQQIPGNYLKKLKIDRGNQKRHHKRENIQTEGPRKLLEEEIRRIRAELEQRKHRLKNVETTSQPLPQNSQPHESGELKLKLGDSPVVTGSHKTPQAPRAVRKKGTLEYIVAPNIENKRRRKSYSPLAQPRLTEYQRAYKAPELTPIPQRPRTAQSEFPTTFKASSHHGQIDIFETEYAREYKPFRYVPIDKLNATTFIRDPNVNIVPIPRPKSAYTLVRSQQIKDTENGYPRSRQETSSQPDLSKKTRSHESRYTSEYGAKYHNYFGLQPNSNGSTEWMRVLEGIRNQADLYRKRDLESHFTRDHLAQLASAFVDYWDQPSSDRYARNREKSLTTLAQPPAGKPSELCSEENEECEAHSTISARRRAMMDSHHVAELLHEYQVYDPKSYSSEVKPESTHSKGEKNNQRQLVRQNDAQALSTHFENQLSSTSPDIEMEKHGTAGQLSNIHRTSQQGNSLSPVSTKSIMSSATPISEPTNYTNEQRNHAVNDNSHQRRCTLPSGDYLCHPYAENHEYRSWDYI